MKNNRLLFICPSYPAIGGVEAVTRLMINFFQEKGYEVYVLISGTDSQFQVDLAKPLSLMTSMKGTLNSKENLAFIDHFILEKDIACVFNQGVFSESYHHASLHKNVLFINTLHSCPFWEVINFSQSTLNLLVRGEKTCYNRFKVIVRYVLNRIKPGLSHPSIKQFYRQQIDSVSYYVVLDPRL